MEAQLLGQGKDSSLRRTIDGDMQGSSAAAPSAVFAQTHSSAVVDVVTGLVTLIVLVLCGVLMCTDSASLDVEHVLAGFLVAFLCLIALYCVISLFRAGTRPSGKQTSSTVTHPASSLIPPLVTKLLYVCNLFIVADVNRRAKRFTFRAGSGTTHQCNVCLDELCEGQHARSLPCGHVYHQSCADAWIIYSRKNSCPLCSQPVCENRDANMNLYPNGRRCGSQGAEGKAN